MQQKKKFKQEQALFTVSGTNSAWGEVLHLATLLEFPKGIEIPGIDSEYFYYLISGSIKLSCLASTGNERVVMVIGAGSLFGEINHLHQSITRANRFHTLEKCSVAKFPQQLLSDDEFYIKYPLLAKNIVHSLGIKAGAFFSQLFDSGVVEVEGRVCRSLYQIWQEEGGRQTVCPNISQSDLAAMLGIHRSSLCRILQSLREQGVIGKFSKKELVVLRPDVLKHLACDT